MPKKQEAYPANTKRIDAQKKLLLQHIEKTPIVEVVCQKVGIGRTTLYRWLHEDESFAKEYSEAFGTGVDLISDLAESKLIGKIQEGDMTAVKLWLGTHRKDFASKVEVSATKQDELSDEEKKTIERAYLLTGTMIASPVLTNPQPYVQPIRGSENNEPDSQQQDGEAHARE